MNTKNKMKKKKQNEKKIKINKKNIN